jgi:chromosome transmission fidelity protein 8
MLIPITITSSSTASLPAQLTKLGNDELVLIELQGSLDVECTDSSERDGQMVGTFRLDEGSVSAGSNTLHCGHENFKSMSQSKPTLAIGHHLLEGKIVSLPKPLGVIQRSTTPSGPHQNAHSHDPGDAMCGIGSGAGSLQWDMVAIVKKKIVFSKRPMPIVGTAATAVGSSSKNG